MAWGSLSPSWVDQGDEQLAMQAAAEAAALRQRTAVRNPNGQPEGAITRGLDHLGVDIYNTLAKPSRVWGALSEVPMGQPLSERPDIVDAVAQIGTDLLGVPALMPGGIVKNAAGIFGGRLAQTADHAKLAEAERMAATGAPAKDIWDSTGWFQGKDKQWRFEIPDNESVFNAAKMMPKEYNIAGRSIMGREGVAGDVLTHPNYFEAYPDAAGMGVGQTRYGGGNRGTYHPPGMIAEQIGLDASLLEGADRHVLPDGARGVMLHELQHRTQEAEKFARGGNPKDISSLPNPDVNLYRNALKNDKELQRYLELRNSPARLAEIEDQNKIWMADYQPRLDPIYSRGRADYNKADADQVFADFNKAIAGKYPLDEESGQLHKSLRARDIPTNEPPEFLTGSDVYSRLAGEVEARNVQNRMNMTPEERRTKPPWVTEDTVPVRQIIHNRPGMVVGPAASEAQPFGSLSPTGIRAYHGSPHDFDRFDLSKIGTGEGAQAYGHGLYFAGNPETAEFYKSALSNKPSMNGSPLLDQSYMTANSTGSEYLDKIIRESFGDMDLAKKTLEANMKVGPSPSDLPYWKDVAAKRVANSQEAMKHLASIEDKITPTSKGHMYEVNINAHPDQFLDWHKPMDQQSVVVRNAFLENLSARKWPSAKVDDILSGDTVGQQALNYLMPSGSKAQASEVLNKSGVPGIKYLDQGSRGTTSAAPFRMTGDDGSTMWAVQNANGAVRRFSTKDAANNFWQAAQDRGRTNNYVVFDDNLIDILRKYALPGAVGGGAFGSLSPGGGGVLSPE